MSDAAALMDRMYRRQRHIYDLSRKFYLLGRDEAITRLRPAPGDKVLMCLVAIPHDCPPGDDRGRVYTVTNMRTAATWTLPDSQHSCGGA